jgi:O-acetyl-ADP-ribose deacetylase (regulator of RNase III)
MKEKIIGEARLTLTQGDVARAEVQAVVNAANSRLAGGGGVDGAIHRAGGPDIMAACRKLGGCPPGQAVITTAGRLPADKVIHTVGPVYSGRPADPQVLASCYRTSLELAVKHGLRTVAFPSISTGAYGYPLELAAPTALKAVKEAIEAHPHDLDEVRFVLFGEQAYAAYAQALGRLA